MQNQEDGSSPMVALDEPSLFGLGDPTKEDFQQVPSGTLFKKEPVEVEQTEGMVEEQCVPVGSLFDVEEEETLAEVVQEEVNPKKRKRDGFLEETQPIKLRITEKLTLLWEYNHNYFTHMPSKLLRRGRPRKQDGSTGHGLALIL